MTTLGAPRCASLRKLLGHFELGSSLEALPISDFPELGEVNNQFAVEINSLFSSALKPLGVVNNEEEEKARAQAFLTRASEKIRSAERCFSIDWSKLIGAYVAVQPPSMRRV